MKTKEFIRKLKIIGYTVEETTSSIYVKRNDCTYVRVNKDKYYQIKTTNDLSNLSDEEIQEVMELVIKYTSTPINEREEPKKYYLTLPNVDEEGFAYLNLTISEKYFFGSNAESTVCQTQFTQEEIDKLPNQEFIKTLIKEEV